MTITPVAPELAPRASSKQKVRAQSEPCGPGQGAWQGAQCSRASLETLARCQRVGPGRGLLPQSPGSEGGSEVGNRCGGS
eukprot:6341745-Pyramimonas_sp.AAC.1